MVELFPLNMEHVGLYTQWENNSKVRIYSRNIIPITEAVFKKWLEEEKKTQVITNIGFEIRHIAENKPIGIVNLDGISWHNRNAWIGLTIGEPEYWSHGIATETAGLILKYSFEELNLHKVYGGIFAPNRGSWRAAEKNGMKREGIFRKQIYVGGEYVDTYLYTMFKRDWLKNHGNEGR
ncbi:MAG: GNAT family N-acetyltransferase [Promethearchaeota archaeon]